MPTAVEDGRCALHLLQCGQVGHFAKECTTPWKIDVPRPQGHFSHPPRVIAAKTDCRGFMTRFKSGGAHECEEQWYVRDTRA
jgi:hypothetical protein